MDEGTIGKLDSDLRRHYGEEKVIRKVLADGTVAFRINAAELPQGCKPERVDALVTFPGGNGSQPQVLVRQQITLANGKIARNQSNTTFDGEAWVGFSANFPYDSSKPLWYFVGGRLRRFAQSD